MIKFLTFTAAAILATTGISRAGGPACCTPAKADSKAETIFVSAKMNLTQEQKAKLAELQTQCQMEGCTDENRAEFLKDAEAILTPEQFAQLKEACEAWKADKPLKLTGDN